MPKAPCILVTGGAGYIGSHVAMELAAQGFEPLVYDNLSRGRREFLRWGGHVIADLADADALRETFRRNDIAAVMHFAAYAYVGESVEQPEAYYLNNVGNTLALLAAMREAGVDRLIFSSSCATYGEPRSLPIDEDHPQAPISPYGRTKLMAEQIMADFSQAYGLKTVCLRYFNAAGADPEGRLGEWHEPETHLIPLVIESALDGGPTLQLRGTDYPTPDGTCVRDYIHVTDLADAHILCLRHLLDGGQGRAYNLGNGRGASVREVIDCVRRVVGREPKVLEAPRRPGDPPILLGSSGRIMAELGWKPRHAALDDIIRSAWNWHKRRG